METFIKALKIFGLIFSLLIIAGIAYGLYTDIPNTAGYVPNEKAIRL